MKQINKSAIIQESEFDIKFKLNSIILLIGPDGSGKTQFAMEQLMLQLKMHQVSKKTIRIAYISMDSIFAELSDNQFFDKHNIEISHFSENANDIFFNKLRNFTSYPVNFDFVIVDGNGLEAGFRESVLLIGEENHYNVSAVIFNYKDKSQHYILDSQTGEKKRPIASQMKLMKQIGAGVISKKDYSSFHILSERDFDKYIISVEDYVLYDQYFLPEDKDYIIIGDIHGCLNELILLLEHNGFVIDENLKVAHPDGKAVVFVGDIIDKGYNIPGVIEFIYENLDVFYLVIGNHESLVYKKLSGTLAKGGLPSADVVGEFFNSIELLAEPQKPVLPREPKDGATEEIINKYNELLLEYEAQNEIYNSIPVEEFERRKVLREKFFKIFESMKSFYLHKNFIVTHSPCEKKYLGKITPEALKAARDFRYPKLRDYKDFAEFMFQFDEKIKFLKDEASDFHSFHVFGHVMTKEISKYKNKINIDTACVAGGELSSIQIVDKQTIICKSVKSVLNSSEQKQLHNFF